MAKALFQEAAFWRFDEIYRCTRERWGTEQADRCISGLFAAFDGVETHQTASRPIPAGFGVVTILHERMHQIDRLRDDFGS